jgi:predicted AlkP superfamily pyrophosphatase or phosphodiesterase
MVKRLIFLVVFAFLSAIFFSKCDQPGKKNEVSRPTLVIGIVVDQMRYDYLYRYFNKYGEGGFKRLLKEGFSFDDAEFSYVPTYTAPGHTSIYTGTTPCVHGMVANEWYDRKLHKTVYCVEDTAVKTVGSISNEGMMSPRRELTTTIGDELKLSGSGKSKVIGISLKDRASILPAGHSADAAYWFDGVTGNWITSTYYMKELPEWVKKFNAEQKAQKYLSTPWNTLLPIAEYTESTRDSNRYEGTYKGEKEPVFPHDLKGLMIQNGGYALLRTTPFGDDLTKDFAMAAIENEHLGKNETTDMLTISFSSTDYIGHQFGTRAIETEDTYLRLDKNIAELLSFLDGYLGKGKVLIFLTADHGAALNPQYLLDRNIPAGYVDEMQVNARVKSALLNKYGTDLVLEIVNQQCYLDKKKIADRGLNLDSIESQTAQVLSQITGIERAIPAYKLNNAGNDFIVNKIRNGYYAERSGDVIFNILPAWLMYQKTGTTHGSPYIDDAHVPMIFYGWHINHGSSAHIESITNIAPTIADLLHISCPDGCTGHPLLQIAKK